MPPMNAYVFEASPVEAVSRTEAPWLFILAAKTTALPAAPGSESARADLFSRVAEFARLQGEYDHARKCHEKSLAISREALGLPTTPLARDILASKLATARLELSEAQAAAAWSTGFAMSQAEIVAEALLSMAEQVRIPA